MPKACYRITDVGGRQTLANEQLELTVDLDRGADIVSLVDRRTGVDVLFRTPWAERAERVARQGSLVWHESSFAAWLESYAGGWQLLCPNAGPPTVRAGITHGFHGEAAIVPWTPAESGPDAMRLQVELHTVPLAIERRLALDGATVAIDDVVRNLSPVAVELDYQHHPAFGSPLLAPGCVVETGARTFVADADASWQFEPNVPVPWPPAGLEALPGRDEPRAVLGWLTDFEEPWAAIRNPELDLGVALRWDAATMPYAWLWQELGFTEGYPWYRRAYAMAIEPSSTPSGGPERRSLQLAGDDAIRTGMRLSLCRGTQAIRSVSESGAVEFEED